MNNPIFNYKDIYKGGVTGNAPMKVSEISNMPNKKDDLLRYILMFNSGKRELAENKNYNNWNGCVFIDIDYKKWLNSDNEYKPDPKKVFIDIWNYLETHCNNFYYMEFSRSLKGFHIIFYIDTEYPTEERYEYLKLLANAITINAFAECGYKEIIEYPEVLDTCTDTLFQGCYLTGIGKINDNCNPEKYDTRYCADKMEELKNKKVKKQSNICNNSNKQAILINKRDINKVDYIPHRVRRSLFQSLSRIYSGEELRNEWVRCAKLIPEENDHTTEYYINIPYKGDWNDKLKGDEYCDIKLLKTFGYDAELVNRRKITKIFN